MQYTRLILCGLLLTSCASGPYRDAYRQPYKSPSDYWMDASEERREKQRQSADERCRAQGDPTLYNECMKQADLLFHRLEMEMSEFLKRQANIDRLNQRRARERERREAPRFYPPIACDRGPMGAACIELPGEEGPPATLYLPTDCLHSPAGTVCLPP